MSELDIALSIRQPWAWLILNGHKRIENRSWCPSLRGDFLIHTGKGCTRDEWESANWAAGDLGLRGVLPPLDQLQRGGIIGRATLIDVIPPCPRGTVRSPHAWHVPDQYGLVLANVQALPFVPCRGSLMFFRPSEAA